MSAGVNAGVDAIAPSEGSHAGTRGASETPFLDACPLCGCRQLQSLRCKTICGNCRTILQSCADL